MEVIRAEVIDAISDTEENLPRSLARLIAALNRWRTAENCANDDLASMELVSARNNARDLKYQIDSIMRKLGG